MLISIAATVIDRHYAGEAGCVAHFISEAWQLETRNTCFVTVQSRLLTRCLLSHKKQREHSWMHSEWQTARKYYICMFDAQEQRNNMVCRLAYLHLHHHYIHTYILRGTPKLGYQVTHIFCITFS